MILGVLIARKGDKWEVIADPNVPFTEQRRGFREVCKHLAESHDEVQLLSSSSGRVKRRKLKKGLVASPEGSVIVDQDEDESSENESPVTPVADAPKTGKTPQAPVTPVVEDKEKENLI
jgi:hypothetical protein